MADKIDANVTGLRFAEEATILTLPGSPVWYPLEPNSYSDFGGETKTVARKPINPSRQRKKGVVVDLDASGGFNQDITFDNTTRLLQGFFFADIREKWTTKPMNAAQISFTEVASTTDGYIATDLLATMPIVNNLVLAVGFTEAANNGLKLVETVSGNDAVNVAGELTAEASPPATAYLKVVGYQFDSATLNVAMNGDLVRLSRASGSVDFTTLGLIPGEWIYVGGDGAGLSFVTNAGGFARVHSVAATYIQLDKTDWTAVAETGTGLTVQIFYGDVLKNEDSPSLITRRTYNVERTLGEDDDGDMSEYLEGAVANELTINIAQADKITVDIAFVAVRNLSRNGATGVKAGDRPAIVSLEAYNTSNDFSRIKMAMADPLDAAPTPLFAYATEMSVKINNNASVNKAIGVLGGFDVSVGTFEVDGNTTAYFANMTAVNAVNDNDDVTLDFVVVKNNAGILFDLPLIALGDGRLSVEIDQPIMLPLDTGAAESSFGHTLLFVSFAYLPDVAG